MKKVIIYAFLFLSGLSAYEPKMRSEGYLAKHAWTDHTKHFAKLFACARIESLFEFGLGEGTKFFLDHCDEVKSLDIVPDNNRNIKAINTRWHEQCVELFGFFYPRWNSELYYCSSAFSFADEISNSGHDPELLDPSYLTEIKVLCDTYLQKKYDVIFVDPGTFLRADLINELFDRSDIIAAHDYREPAEHTYGGVYGWGKVRAPENYEKIYFSEGCGTVFWVNKEKKDLIQALKTYK